MKWVTCERPKIDRIACPWLVARFAGLFAVSLSLSRNFSDDHEMLRHGRVMYNAGAPAQVVGVRAGQRAVEQANQRAVEVLWRIERAMFAQVGG